MTIKKKKIIWVAALLIIAAFTIVLCVGIFVGKSPDKFDGTLVQVNSLYQGIL